MSETKTPPWTSIEWSLRENQHGVCLIRPGCTQESLQVYPEADAKLIAAAPELWAALEEIGFIASANTNTPAGGIFRKILDKSFVAMKKAGWPR